MLQHFLFGCLFSGLYFHEHEVQLSDAVDPESLHLEPVNLQLRVHAVHVDDKATVLHLVGKLIKSASVGGQAKRGWKVRHDCVETLDGVIDEGGVAVEDGGSNSKVATQASRLTSLDSL